MAENEETNKIKIQIEKWLLEEGFKVHTYSESKNLFTLLIEDQSGVKAVIFQPLLSVDRILVTVEVEFSEEQQAKLKAMNKPERSQFLLDVRLGLLNMQVNFSPIAIIPKEVRIIKEIYYDGLTKNSFMDCYGSVRRAVALLLCLIERKVGGNVKPSTDLSYIG